MIICIRDDGWEGGTEKEGGRKRVRGREGVIVRSPIVAYQCIYQSSREEGRKEGECEWVRESD